MKAGLFLISLAEKAGLDKNSEDLKALAALDMEIPTHIVNVMDTKLMTEASAKSNPALKGHFISSFADGIETSLFEKMKKLGLPENILEEVKTAEKTSGKRIELAFEKLHEHKENQLKEAKKSGDKDSEKVYKEQINDLNNQMASMKEEWEKEKGTLLSGFEQDRINDETAREFLSKNWSKNYKDNLRRTLADVALKEALENLEGSNGVKGAKVVRDPETKKLKLVQAKNPEMDFFDKSNKKINFTELVDNIMLSNNFLAVSDDDDSGQGTSKTTVGGGNPQTQGTSKNPVLDLIRKSQQDQQNNAI